VSTPSNNADACPAVLVSNRKFETRNQKLALSRPSAITFQTQIIFWSHAMRAHRTLDALLTGLGYSFVPQMCRD
jgi:hypothetical protein